MADLISRQAAIDALESIGSLDTEADREYARSVFETLPSAQPEIVRCKDCKLFGNSEQFPSVQPEIIHCKECKYGVQDEDKRWYCRSLGCQVGEADGSGFCADAERRTDD